MGKKQDNAGLDSTRRAAHPDVPSRGGDVEMTPDPRNPKTLDRDHGTEIAVAKVLWIATTSERES